MAWWMALPALLGQSGALSTGATAAGGSAAGASGAAGAGQGMGLTGLFAKYAPQNAMPVEQTQPQQGQRPSAASGIDAQNQWKARTDGVNNIFNSLRGFGMSLQGPDLTPLNDIPRNTPPIIYPQNNQNPGSVALMALMQKIAGA